MKLLLSALLFLHALAALAVPEADYKRLMQDGVAPHFASFQKGTFKSPERGLMITFRKLIVDKDGPTLVILPGRSEHGQKYAELAYDLKDLGHNIFILDHRGQGDSDRMLEDSHKGHVVSFSHYERDLKHFMDTEVLSLVNKKKISLLAHSMGGAIGVRYHAANPVFQKIVLNAPMFQINTQPYSELVARLYSTVLVTAGKGDGYAPKRGPYVPAEDTFETNEVTHSPVRFENTKALVLARPSLALGGATARWVNQTLKATKSIHKLGPKVTVPVLLLQAGQDTLVKPRRQELFCESAPECKLVSYGDARHEILMESDSIRDAALQEITSFLAE